MDQQTVIDVTRRWISTMVIGLNLCPFARRVFETEMIRYVVSSATAGGQLLEDIVRQLEALAAASIDDVETTLLIHPHVFTDFLDYNDFIDEVEKQLRDMGLEGTVQIASFHPDYQFADSAPDDAANFTNRSPFPMLHLLREQSFSRILGDPEELLEIPRRNIATLRGLGRAKILEKLKSIRE